MVLKAINKDKYFLSTVIISLMVAVLIHFPESVSLFDRFESHSLFPGMKFMDVANEILFTFVSLLILFAINTRLFHFNQASIKITAKKIHPDMDTQQSAGTSVCLPAPDIRHSRHRCDGAPLSPSVARLHHGLPRHQQLLHHLPCPPPATGID